MGEKKKEIKKYRLLISESIVLIHDGLKLISSRNFNLFNFFSYYFQFYNIFINYLITSSKRSVVMSELIKLIFFF